MLLGKGLGSFQLQQVQGMRLKSAPSALTLVASSDRDSNGCCQKSPPLSPVCSSHHPPVLWSTVLIYAAPYFELGHDLELG